MDEPGRISISVNGDRRSVPAGISVAALLEELNAAGRRVAVERNGAIVPRSLHTATGLAHGDRLEIVMAVGGG